MEIVLGRTIRYTDTGLSMKMQGLTMIQKKQQFWNVHHWTRKSWSALSRRLTSGWKNRM